MPIIINEVQISVEVVPDNNSQGTGQVQTNSASREEIIKECVEKVLEILNQKIER